MQSRTDPRIASQHYRSLELTSRIEGASPHGLASLLYEEMLRNLDLALVTAVAGKAVASNSHVTKALSIVVALQASLDFEKGGDLAMTLARVYSACSRELNEAGRTGDVDKMSEIREAISDIAYAWQVMTNG